jgi:ribosomal protein S27AE
VCLAGRFDTGSMRNVPRLSVREQFFCQEPEYRRVRPSHSTGLNFLHDLFSGVPPSQIAKLSRPTMDDQELLRKIDVEKRTTRGRVCPRCGGKIIPSRRAVYQSTGEPNALFPVWQCERCGYEELVERAPKQPAKKH